MSIFRAAVYANRHYLAIYKSSHPERLAKNGEGLPKVIGDVFIHPTATVHPTAVVGAAVVSVLIERYQLDCNN